MNTKKYEEPSMEIQKLENEDVIVTSGYDDAEDIV